MLGYNVLPTNTRVRLSTGQLVPIEDLSGSGPQGPPGPEGPEGPPGTVDTSQFYTRGQVDFALAANRPSSGLSDGAQTYDSNMNVIRNILGTGGIVTHIFMNPTYPDDSRNGALVVNGDNVSGGSGIDPNVATFEDNMTPTAISLKKPTTCSLGLDVANGLVADVMQATQITTQFFNSNGLQVAGNGSVFGTFTVGDVSCPGEITAARLMATGDLPSSYSSPGAFFGLVPSVGYASCVLNSSSASKMSQLDMTYVGAPIVHASLVSDPGNDKFEIRTAGNPRLSIEASSATVHSNLSCFDMSASNLTSANDLTVGGNAAISGTLTVNGSPVGGGSLSAMEGSGLTIDGSDIKLNHGNWITQGWGDQADQSGFQSNGNRWDGHSYTRAAIRRFSPTNKTRTSNLPLWLTRA